MRDLLRFAVVPAFIALCLVFGGSAQGIWTNALLQLIAIAICVWALLSKSAQPLRGPAKVLAMIAGLTIGLIGLQLIPLPPAIWSSLPGRDFVAEGYRLIGIARPWLPISLTPHATMATALTLLPPIALLSVMLLTGAYRGTWLAVTILGVTLAAVLLGALQVGSANPLTSPWYFYPRTNHGVATGFFANSNHMASLLVISVPILFALVRDLRDRSTNAKARSAIMLMAGAGVVVLLLGIVLNGSLAILLLGPPVVLGSAIILFPRLAKLRRPLAGIAVAGGAVMLALYMSPLHDRLSHGDETSIAERQQMWSHSAEAIPDFMPVGSGLSSFGRIYPRYEDPASISREFTSHAHNDYLEIALEMGVPGILLLIGFLLWWAARTRAIWASAAADPFAQAATIVTAALLLHSIVDYPLRTAALSAVMATFLAIMARPREAKAGAAADLWPTRHAKI
jgi:O-antigen ligase